MIRDVFHRRCDEEQTGTLNNVIHWSYGTGWGTAYTLADGVVKLPVIPRRR